MFFPGAAAIAPRETPSAGSGADLSTVLTVEPILLPNMEPDGRLIYASDKAYEYWMKVFTALR
jgi:hypothetical protein